MPWELELRADGGELGDVPTVRAQIAAALPGIEFYVEPSGPEKLAAAGAMGIEHPEVIRRHFEQLPARLRADFEGADFSLQFYGFDSQPLQTIYVDVRGSGDPLPALKALCTQTGWSVIECASRQPVNFAGTTAAGWDAFRNYRDRAVEEILESDKST